MQIRTPSRDDLGAVVEVLADAFEQDPVIARFVRPGVSHRRRKIARLFLSDIRSAGIEAVDAAWADHAVVDSDAGTPHDTSHTGLRGDSGYPTGSLHPAGPLLGAAIWQAPGQNQRRSLWSRFSEAVGLWAALGLGGVRELSRYAADTGRHVPAGPHWHLIDIGASPAARGQGVGRALLEHRLAVIDARGEAVFLEATTPASRRLYERYGFESIAVIDHGPASGATMMARPARGA